MRILFLFAALLAAPLHAQSRDAATTLGRDVLTPAMPREGQTVDLPVLSALDIDVAGDARDGLFIGAVNVEGARDMPRAAFAAVIEPFIGKQADARDLQALARAVANVARERGYIFASAMVPEQVVDAGTVTVMLDAGSVDRVAITGSDNRKLKRILARIVGPAVRRETFERQMLLAGDIPGMVIVSTRYGRAADSATLFVEARDDRASGSAGLDNYGSAELGPARLRLRFDLTGLLGDGDQLVTQLVITPLQPKELAYGSLRYTIGIGSAGTQIGAAVAAGKTKPGGMLIAGRLTGDSRYGAIFINHPVLRSVQANLWVNGELAHLRVDQKFDGNPAQRDDITTLTLSMMANAKFAGSRLWGGFSVVQGLGGTRGNDPMASRINGSGRFTKAVGWVSWTGSLAKQFRLRITGNGQIASRPLLAAQEIGLGGPGVGRAYDFSERFGDSGVMGLIELQQQFDKLLPGVDWVQTYQFVDGGYVENMADSFGDGTRFSAGAGLRAAFSQTNVGIEFAFPLNARRFDGDSVSPRINLTVGRNF